MMILKEFLAFHMQLHFQALNISCVKIDPFLSVLKARYEYGIVLSTAI